MTTEAAPAAPALPATISDQLTAHVAKVKADLEAGTAEFDKLWPDWLAHLESVLKTLKLPASDVPAVEAEIKAVTQEVVAFVTQKLKMPSAFQSLIETAIVSLVEKYSAAELAKIVI